MGKNRGKRYRERLKKEAAAAADARITTGPAPALVPRPTSHLSKSSRPTTPRYLEPRGAAWLRVFLFLVRQAYLGASWLGYSEWIALILVRRQHRNVEFAATWIFRLVTLLSFSYLIYDRFYETRATISIASTDDNPFHSRFAITNNSHLFVIRNVHWSCRINSLKGPNVDIERINEIVAGSRTIISEGDSVNFRLCSVMVVNGAIVTEGEVVIEAQYETDVFGLWLEPGTTGPVTFTWLGSSFTPHWIRGDKDN